MFRRAFAPHLAPALTALLLSAPLAGCTTQNIAPPPSQAVQQARQARAVKPAACTPGGLAAISPVELGFGFDDAKLSEVGQQHLAAAAQWLACNPGVAVVILPEADHHGDDAHLTELASNRAKAAQDQLRALGATGPTIHILSRGAADPVSEPHMVINATGRGW
jgi:outer membrane protein OmpA-like peptidoglycan-associated protein